MSFLSLIICCILYHNFILIRVTVKLLYSENSFFVIVVIILCLFILLFFMLKFVPNIDNQEEEPSGSNPILVSISTQGRIQDFKLGGVHLKKLHRAEGGAKHFGLFRVKNHIFSNFRGGHTGYPPLDPPLVPYICMLKRGLSWS